MPRPAHVRYAGLAGSLLLAVAAYRGGAHSPWTPTITPGTIFTGQNGVVTPVAWLFGTALLIGAWWVGRRHIPSARWAYVTAALWMVPLLPFLPLGSYDSHSYACQGWQQAVGLDPYAGGVDVLGCPWADSVAPTWRGSPAPYGPVFLLLAALAAKLGGSLTGTIAVLRIVAVAGVALIAASLPAVTRRTGVPLKRAVWLALACPLVPIHLISGTHNDAVMIGLILAGLAVAAAGAPWSDRLSAADRPSAAGPPLRNTPAPAGQIGFRRFGTLLPLLAGVLLGLAIGVKATAVVVLPFALLIVAFGDRSPFRDRHFRLAWLGGMRGGAPEALPGGVGEVARGGGRVGVGEVARGGGLVAGVVLALGVVSWVSGRGLGWVSGLAGSGVSVQWTSPSTAVGMTIGLFGVDAVPVTRVIGMAVLAGVLVWLWGRALFGGDVWVCVGWAMVATVVLAPVFHPWYATWALVLGAATLRRGERWVVGVAAVVSALCLPDGYNLALAVKTQGAVAMTAAICYFGYVRLKRMKAADAVKSSGPERAVTDHSGDRVSRRDP